jgi:hypothetical protein
MEPRLADPRVGWFTVSQYDYGSNELKSDKKTYIRRWRLEPKILWLTPKGNWLNQSLSFIYTTPENFVNTSRYRRMAKNHLKLQVLKTLLLRKTHQRRRRSRF